MIKSQVKEIDYKNWHDDTKEHLANDFQKQGYTVTTEQRIMTPGGHKKWRTADIIVKELSLVVEVQKSKTPTKDWKQRNEDYKKVGYKVIWVMHDNRWQPDSDQNPELSNEDEDIFIKWRDYNPTLNRAQHIYNSARFGIIDYAYNHPDLTIMYAIPSAGQSSLMYRKLENIEEINRVLTPKFSDGGHYGSTTDFKNHNQPPETFKGYSVSTSIIAKDTFKLKEVA